VAEKPDTVNALMRDPLELVAGKYFVWIAIILTPIKPCKSTGQRGQYPQWFELLFCYC
jgi:hypothetical protein